MISVFTPLSQTGNRYIEAAYETLCAQTHQDWEWIVLENHGGVLPKKIRKDKRVKLHGDTQLQGIGALKRRCCELSKGDILFEFDHDDLLHVAALAETQSAIDAGADFVVSDFAEFHSETWAPNVYRKDCGWTSYPVTFQGHELLAQPNPPITPQNLRRVEWAPNHLRAWRREAYWKVGGHNPELPVIDDHELIVRCYLAGLKFHHIPQCLYFYRVHKEQTVTQKNQLIQDLTQQIYDKYIFELAEKFANESVVRMGEIPPRSLRKIDLCGGIDTYKDYEAIDQTTGYDLDQSWDPWLSETTRNGTRSMPVPNPAGLKDNSVGVIRAFDAIEHLKSPIHTMNEAYRVLAPGGFLLIQVPSSDGRGAFQDPTHVSFWNENSFWYYTRSSHSRYIPDFKGRFQVAKLRSYFPGDSLDDQGKLVPGFHRQNAIPYVEAHLIALKPGYAPMGEVLI